MSYQIDPSSGLFPEGIYLFEVLESFEKMANSGNMMFVVKLRDVASNRTLTERWMVQGGGQHMTSKKLVALGIDITQPVDAPDVIGRRMIAKVKHTPPKNGFEARAELGTCWPEDKPPREYVEGYIAPPRPPTDEESGAVPF